MRRDTNPGKAISAEVDSAHTSAPRAAAPDHPISAADVTDISASTFGIPENEFTPSVRRALITLQLRVDGLRREAESANARLNDAAKYADLDVLLPILNRRAFVRELNRFISFTERYGTPSCLFYFDVDKLKAVNDLHGHAAGDAVLGHFANVLKSQIRETDILARIGGDEFGVILAHSTLEQATRKGEKLVQAVKQAPGSWNGQHVYLRFSYGIHKLRAGESAEVAIANADAAMYAHKRTQD